MSPIVIRRGLALIAILPLIQLERHDLVRPHIVVGIHHWSPGTTLSFRAEGLRQSQLATMSMETLDASGNVWKSGAVWRVGRDGAIDPATAAPVDGSYATTDPDGLVWSMTQRTGSPTLYTFPDSDRIRFDLSLSLDDSILSRATIWRYRTPNGVTRTPLSGLVAGTAFQPSDHRQHPAVLLLGGSGGGHPLDDEAAALAADGYVTLSLAYYGAPGLPDRLVRIPLESAERGVDWLRALPSVDPRRIAVIGHSRGSELAQLVAANDSNVRAVVLLAGSPVAWPGLDPSQLGRDLPSWTVRDSAVPTLASGKFFGQVLREQKPPIVAFERALSDTIAVGRAMLPITEIRGPMLWISGDSDELWPANDLAARAIAWRARHHVPFADKWVHFADAGHWLFIEGAPLDHRITLPLPGRTVAFGGTVEGDAAAARKAWSTIREFLRGSFLLGSRRR